MWAMLAQDFVEADRAIPDAERPITIGREVFAAESMLAVLRQGIDAGDEDRLSLRG